MKIDMEEALKLSEIKEKFGLLCKEGDNLMSSKSEAGRANS